MKLWQLFRVKNERPHDVAHDLIIECPILVPCRNIDSQHEPVFDRITGRQVSVIFNTGCKNGMMPGYYYWDPEKVIWCKYVRK